MKVGDDQRTQRAEREKQQEKKRREETQRQKERRFSEIMNRRDSPKPKRSGDERTRRLHEGKPQKQRRDREGRRLERNVQNNQTAGQTSSSHAPEEQREPAVTIDDRRRDQPGVLQSDRSSGEQPQHRGIDDVRRRTERTGSTTDPRLADSRPAVEVVAREILQAARFGEDDRTRRVVFLDVTVPGRGDIRIRLKRDGSGGFEVRLRAGNDSLGRTLQHGSDELRRRGQRQGVRFSSIRVVR